MAEADYIPRLKTHYDDSVRAQLTEQFSYANPMQVPKLDKVVLNMGIGEATTDTKKVKSAYADMELIAGQKPVVTRARNSIATFKVREDMPLGVKVTLRKANMYEFIDRLVNIALPRIKDFRGLKSNGFDKFGNYTFGIKEHIIFPEVNFDKVEKIRGLDITVVIKSKRKVDSLELLKKLNFPFIEKERNN